MSNKPKYKLMTLEYGIGYGTHRTEIEVDIDATEDEIEEIACDYVMERVWWATSEIDADED